MRQHQQIRQPRAFQQGLDRLFLGPHDIEGHILARQADLEFGGIGVVTLQRLANRVGGDVAAAHRIDRHEAGDRGIDQHTQVPVVGPRQRQRGFEPRGHGRAPVGKKQDRTHDQPPMLGGQAAVCAD